MPELATTFPEPTLAEALVRHLAAVPDRPAPAPVVRPRGPLARPPAGAKTRPTAAQGIDFDSHTRAALFEDLDFLARAGVDMKRALARVGRTTDAADGGVEALWKHLRRWGRLDLWDALQANSGVRVLEAAEVEE